MQALNIPGQPLTRYPVGSLREIWMMSFPLMLTAASGCLMHFFDRVILSHYSLEAMNTAVTAYMPMVTLQFSTLAIAAIAEVFVGQYNGAGKKEQLGWPVWQMVYFSFLTSLIFFPVAFWLAPYLIPSVYKQEGAAYLSLSLYFGPIFPLIAALSCFFIGRGRVWMVTIATFLANILNVGLAWVFVFGWRDVIPSMGIQGAAWATGLSVIAEAILLGFFFLSSDNRRIFKTGDARFRPHLFLQCLKVGVPSSIGHLVEIAGWSLILYMVAECSPIHATIFNICQSLWILFSFLIEGLSKGVIALVANALGAGKLERVRATYRSAILLCLIIFSLLLGLSWAFPGAIISLFFDASIDAQLASLAMTGLRLITLVLFFDAIAWASAGVIIAAGDTRFVMITGIWITWFLVVIPVYYFVVHQGGGPLLANTIGVGAAAINAGVYAARYFSGKWRLAALDIQETVA